MLEDPVSSETIGTVYKKYKCCILEERDKTGGEGEREGERERELTLKILDLEGETTDKGLPRDTVWGS